MGGMRDDHGPMRIKLREKLTSINPLALVLGLSFVFFILFISISGLMLLRHSSPSTPRAGVGASLFSGGSVGVVELNGVIMDAKKVIKQLERFEDSGEVRAVVLRLNSPGGAVAPSQEIYEMVRKMKKPVVASMSSVAASGAYYVACATKKIFANPGTITGSIGVIMEFANLEKLYEWAHIKRYALKTGKFKGSGAEYRDMTLEERALLQGMIDDVLQQFKKAVSDGRKLPMAAVTAVADGRVFSGSQAKGQKLVDELGTLQDAVNEAAKMGGIKGKPKVVYPEKPQKKLVELIMDEATSGGKDSDDESSSSHLGGFVALLRGILGERVLTNPASGFLPSPGIYWIWNGWR